MATQMNLIHVLTNYMVVWADDHSAMVGYMQHPQSIDLLLHWKSEGQIYSAEVVDQPIELLDQTSSRGMFTVQDSEGDELIFIAYTEAELG